MQSWSQFSILLFFSILFQNSFTCPFVLNNDTKTAILVVDPHNKQAVYINPGHKAEIDPSIFGWKYYFYHEKLDIYMTNQDNQHLFYRRYQLVEKYCTAGKTNLSLSEIIQFIHTPTDRFNVFEFKPHIHKSHTH